MRAGRAQLDLVLLLPVGLLLVIGALMVYSSSLIVAYNEYRNDTYFLVRQLSSIGVGLLVMFVLAQIDYHRWQRYSVLILAVGIVLLVLVLIPSFAIQNYGSARWLKLPFFQIQPSEYIKLALVIYMADWLASKGNRVRELQTASIRFLATMSLICGLVVVEPDFGTTVVIALTAVSIFFVAGANLWHFAPGMAVVVAAMWFVMTQLPYRVERISAWLRPFDDPLGRGWHTLQTLTALGSGGLLGLGLGASRQKHYWLVNAHTDAILAIVGEEAGLVGTLTVLMLFGVLVWRGLLIAYRSDDAYGRLLAAGLVTMILWQTAINVAVVTNSAPYTGVTLPFLSYGGSSTVISLAAVGLLLSVARHPGRPAVRLTGDDLPAAPARSAVSGRPRRSRLAVQPTRVSAGRLSAPIELASERNYRARASGRAL